jgi:outer membrane protein assembly factor BamB
MNSKFLATTLAAIGSLSFHVPTASADDVGWPQFQGPDRTGISTESGLLKKWPGAGPKEIWSLDVGEGFGGASIVGNDVYILDRPDPGTEALRCLDFRTGKEKWNHTYTTKQVKLPHAGSRSTPTIDGDHVYTFGRLGNLVCVNRKTRKAVWSHDILSEYKLNETARWGYSSSPLVVGEVVIVPALNGEVGHLLGYDKTTGKLRWQVDKTGGAHYVSPQVYDIAGVKQVLTYGRLDSEQGRYTSVDAQTGKVLWRWDGYFNKIMIPMPTNMGDGRLFVTGGYGCGTVMLQINRRGSKYSVKELYRIDAEGSQMHPAILHEGHLYINWNTNENLKGDKKKTGGLVCLDPDTGKILWRTGMKPNFERGNLIFADGMIIILDGELGELALVDPSPGGYNELARAKVFTNLRKKGNKIWAPMALTDGKLIVRSQKELKCIALR